MISNVILIFTAVLVVVLGGLFAGAETGMYQMSRLRLRLGIAKQRFTSVVLGKVMRDSAGFLLSMLIGTNLAHYLVTSIITVLLLSRTGSEHSAEAIATAITVPVLFVYSELIPKNIFFYRADSLMTFLSPVLFVFHKIFTWSGIVGLLRAFSSFFGRIGGAAVSAKTVISDVRSSQIKAIFHETREEAFLSSVQRDMMNRIVSIPNIRLSSVMTPVAKVQMLSRGSGRGDLLSMLSTYPFTRVLVYDRLRTNIVGFVNIYEALSCGEKNRDLGDFVQPIRKLAAETTVTDAINFMQSENQKIIMVTRGGQVGRERAIGIVTMKDLVEELLGELVEW